MPGEGTLGERFAGAPNALNLVRLLLAGSVVGWHAWSIPRGGVVDNTTERFVADVGVDGFFAISGFLIVGAWERRSDLWSYGVSRIRRIFPGLGVCLLVTAFVVAPIVTLMATGDSLRPFDQARYVLLGLGFCSSFNLGGLNRWDIAGTPTQSPDPGVWNGSLWSLGYEFACYVAVASLGRLRLVRPPAVAGIFLFFWLWSLAGAVSGHPESGLPIFQIPRTGMMFAAGTMLWLARDRVPVAPRWAALAGVVIVSGALLPNYRLVAAPALAYLLIYGSLLLASRWSRSVLRHDLSYGVYLYGFVIQQALLSLGCPSTFPVLLLASACCVTPVAAASWFLVERPMLRRRWTPVRPLPSATTARGVRPSNAG